MSTNEYIRVGANIGDTFKILEAYTVSFENNETTEDVKSFIETEKNNFGEDGIYRMYDPYTSLEETLTDGENATFISYMTKKFDNITNKANADLQSSVNYHTYIYTLNNKGYGNVTYVGVESL